MSDPNNPTDYPNAGSGDAAGAPPARNRPLNGIYGYVSTGGGANDDGAAIIYHPYVGQGNYIPEYRIGHFRAVIDHYENTGEFGQAVPVYRTEGDPRFPSLLPFAFGQQGRIRQFDDYDETIGITPTYTSGSSVSGYTKIPNGGSQNPLLSDEFYGYTGPGLWVSYCRMTSNYSSGFATTGGRFQSTTSDGSLTGTIGNSGGVEDVGSVPPTFHGNGDAISYTATVLEVGSGQSVSAYIEIAKATFPEPIANFTVAPVSGSLLDFVFDASASLGSSIEAGLPLQTISRPIIAYHWTIQKDLSNGQSFIEITTGGPILNYHYDGPSFRFGVSLTVEVQGARSYPAGQAVDVLGGTGRGGITDLVVTPPVAIGPVRAIADTRNSTPPQDHQGNDIPLVTVTYDWGDGTVTTEDYGRLAYHDYKSSGDYVVHAQAHTAKPNPVLPAQGPTKLALDCKLTGKIKITHDYAGSAGGPADPLLITWPANRQAGSLASGSHLLQPGETFEERLHLAQLKPSDFKYSLVVSSPTSPITKTFTQTGTVAVNRSDAARDAANGVVDLTKAYTITLGALPDGAVVTSMLISEAWRPTDPMHEFESCSLQFGVAPGGTTPFADGHTFIPHAPLPGNDGTNGQPYLTSGSYRHPAVFTLDGQLGEASYDLYFSNITNGNINQVGTEVIVDSYSLTRSYSITTNVTTEDDKYGAHAVGGPENKTIDWAGSGAPTGGSVVTKKQPLQTVWASTIQIWFATFDPDPNQRDPQANPFIAMGYLIHSRQSAANDYGSVGVDANGQAIHALVRKRGDGAYFIQDSYHQTYRPGGGLVDYDAKQMPVPTGPIDTGVDYVPFDELAIPVVPFTYRFTDGTTAQAYWKVSKNGTFGSNLNIKQVSFDGPAITDQGALDDFVHTKMELTAYSTVDTIGFRPQTGPVDAGGVSTSGVAKTLSYDLTSDYQDLLHYGHNPSALEQRDAGLYALPQSGLRKNASGLLAYEVISYPGQNGELARQYPITGIKANRIYAVSTPAEPVGGDGSNATGLNATGPNATPAVLRTTVLFTCDKVAPDDPVPPYVPDYSQRATGGPDFLEYARTT